ncbi:ferredoxin-NADP reductase [Paraburkholderia youngii]|uniref:PDR/VanB family oxidoreductase n=1 Tax=Paraburkholderia youngii TaxID=2782701 RepID=UPI003D23DC1C
MSDDSFIDVRIKSMTWESKNTISLVLERVDGSDLPKAEAGSHIDIRLGSRLSRSYSIVSAQGAPRVYEIAVARDANSRGASQYVHDAMRVGDLTKISTPRNLFPVDPGARVSILFAGGIGITPIWSMVRQLEALGREWHLHYSARDREHAAYLKEIERFVQGSTGGRLYTYFDEIPGGTRVNMATVIAESPADAHVYCCGPTGMLDAFEAAASSKPGSQVHLERFSAAEPPSTGGVSEFDVVLAKSGATYRIPEDRSILDVLLDHNVDVQYGCMQGTCGMCEVKVIDGTPSHADKLLSAEEKAERQCMLVCCSRSASPTLTLDL